MAKKDSKICGCCGGFPIFAVIALVLGILWFLSDIGIIATNISWLPLIVIITALGMIAHHHGK